MLQQEDRAMVFYIYRVTHIVKLRRDIPVHIRARDEQIKLRNFGLHLAILAGFHSPLLKGDVK
jgi:hypothetical protein